MMRFSKSYTIENVKPGERNNTDQKKKLINANGLQALFLEINVKYVVPVLAGFVTTTDKREVTYGTTNSDQSGHLN